MNTRFDRLYAAVAQLEEGAEREVVIAGLSAPQSIPSAGAYVSWDSEVLDRQGSLAGTTFTAGEAGAYHVCATVDWFDNADWPLGVDVSVIVGVNDGNIFELDSRRLQAAYNGRLRQLGGCTALSLADGDRVRIKTVYNVAGAARNISHGGTRLTIFEL